MTTVEELRQGFEHFDRDGNGCIDLEEFALLLDSLNAGMTADEVAEGFRTIDRDGSGTIDFDEFCAWWAD